MAFGDMKASTPENVKKYEQQKNSKWGRSKFNPNNYSDHMINIIWYLVWVVLALMSCFFIFKNSQLTNQLKVLNHEADIWSIKADKNQAKANHVIVVPTKQAGNMTPNEAKAVKSIGDFFADITTWHDSDGYESNRREAKSWVSDQSFFGPQGFFAPNKDSDGHNFIANSGIKAVNKSVRVLPMGGNHYYVVVAFYEYHNDSDLYQKSKMTATVRCFDVNGTPNHLSKVSVLKQFDGEYNNEGPTA